MCSVKHRSVRVLEPQTRSLTPGPARLSAELQGHSDVVAGVEVSWGMDRALSWADDTTLRLWDLKETGACRISSRGLENSCLFRFAGHCGPVWSAQVDWDSGFAMSYSFMQMALFLWNLQDGTSSKFQFSSSESFQAWSGGAEVDWTRHRAVAWTLTGGSLSVVDLDTGALRQLDGQAAVTCEDLELEPGEGPEPRRRMGRWAIAVTLCTCAVAALICRSGSTRLEAVNVQGLQKKYEDTLELMAPEPRPVSVILQRISGETWKLEATSADTTEHLKRRIFESFDIPEEEQQLPAAYTGENRLSICGGIAAPRLVEDAHGVPADQQVLVPSQAEQRYAGQQLKDEYKALGDCNIQGLIYCVVRNRKQGPTFTVTVKVLSGQSFDLSVAAADTIQEVKAQIEKYPFRFDVNISGLNEKQRLVFAGKLLCDTATVSESRIEDGNTLHLVVRLTVQGEAGSTMESQGTVCNLRGTCDSPGACGLLNLGNTCYLNSTLQALSNTVALRRYYEAGHYKADISCTPDSMGGRLADGFANLLRSIWGNEFRIVKPHEVRNLISEKWSQFAGYRQHDAQELLMFLLDGLHEDVKRIPSPCPRGSESASSQCDASDSQDAGNCQTDSKIKDIFHFQVRSTTTFCDVGMRSEKFEPMVYLTLPIPGPEDTAPAERSIIHLKRFVADSSSIDKDGSFVRFPFELDLSQWLAGPPTEEGLGTAARPDMRSNCKSLPGEQYKLYAVVNHSGSLSYGHYTAYCKVGEGSDKKWYLFNDARVTQASESDVVSPEAYLLFYERF
eukprot:s4138_g2.t1